MKTLNKDNDDKKYTAIPYARNEQSNNDIIITDKTFVHSAEDKKVLMNYQAILKYNAKTLKNDATLYNLDTITSLNKKEIEKILLISTML